MSDTPRTEARLKALYDEGAYADSTAIDSEFARELERANDKLVRVLFEIGLARGVDVLSRGINDAVLRQDLQAAGGMPTLTNDLEGVRRLITARYETATAERRHA